VHVLLITIPATGHVNPTLDLTAALTGRGHRVSYAVPQDFGWAAKMTGAEHLPYVSTIVPRPSQSPPAADFAAWLPFVLAAEAELVLPQLFRQLSTDPPDVVVYDRTAYLIGQALAELLHRPAVGLFCSFAWNEHVNLMPSGSGIVDAEIAAALRARLDELAGFWDTTPVSSSDLLLGRTENAIVLVPAELQPAAETFPAGYHFTGPGLRLRRSQARAAPAATVYASLGTAFNDRAETFAAVAQAIGRLGVPGLLSVGPLSTEIEAAPEVRVAHCVDQLAALEKARVFVTHAGTGSVLESIAAGVPLLCIPQTTEHVLIASRIAELGLGVVATGLGVDDLTTLIGHMLDDEALRDRVAALGRRLDPEAGQRGAAILEAL
jgi:MGT family glycosyltransferase